MRSVFPYKCKHTGRITDANIVNFAGHNVHQVDIVRDPRQPDTVPKPRQSHQHVAVLLVHERRIDAQIAGDYLARPAATERPPRLVQLLEREITKVRLQQLLHVITELHVEVALEDVALLLGHPVRVDGVRVQAVEDVDGGLAEEPRVRVIAGHHFHAQTEVAVAGEDVDGAADSQLIVVGLDIISVGWESGQ